MNTPEIQINFYTRNEEIANTVTHGIGAAGALAAVVLLAIATRNSKVVLIPVLIYSISLLTMYSSSTLYHAATRDNWKLLFRRLDYCSIYLLIAGTYTPLLLLIVGGVYGWILLTVLWMLALIGIGIKSVSMREFGGLSLYLYLAMGWTGIFCLKTLFYGMSTWGILCMFAGGLAYTAGIPFFLKEWQYAHTLWHVFVLAGTFFHFLMVLSLV